MFSFAKLRKNTGTGTLSFKSAKRTIQAFIFFYSNLCHFQFPPFAFQQCSQLLYIIFSCLSSGILIIFLVFKLFSDFSGYRSEFNFSIYIIDHVQLAQFLNCKNVQFAQNPSYPLTRQNYCAIIEKVICII